VETLARFLTSPVGRKILMALTGLFLSLFLVAHLTGNMLLFVGADAFNEYSHALTSNPLIYLAEGGLLLLFVAHFVSGILIYRRGKLARPVPYDMKEPAGHTSHKTLASSSMIFSGIFLLIFVPLHLKTFKFGAWYETTAAEPIRDLYRLTVEIFENPLYVLFYMVSMVIIGFHLYHGVGSAFQSLGIYYRKGLLAFGRGFAVVIAGGFFLVPILLFLFGGNS
jgi:succinate dehydrogenase / fumarate reductase cytochrome b subunit